MNTYRKLKESFSYANIHQNNGHQSAMNGSHHDDDGNDADDDDDDEAEIEEYSALFLNKNNNSNNNNKSNINQIFLNKINNCSNNKNNKNFSELINNHSNTNNNLEGELQKHNRQQHFINNSNIMSASNNINNTSNVLVEAEESTMEVPLLHQHDDDADANDDGDYDDKNNYDDDPVLKQYPNSKGCQCQQPGFAANLQTKSTQEAKCRMIFAVSLCCIFMIIEFLGGYFAGSLAIMADAAHLASDCISFIIGLVAIWLGSRKPDVRMSFGYKRMEVMGAVVSILGIWMLTATLVMVAIQRIYSNDYDLDANNMMTISGIGILINIAMIFILHGSAFLPVDFTHGHSHSHTHAHSHSHTHTHSDTQLPLASTETDISMCENGNATGNGQKVKTHKKSCSSNKHTEKNLNLRAAMIHVIGDLVQSIGVFFAAVLIKFFPAAEIADPLCTILFSFIVMMTTTRLFKESMTILLDAVPNCCSLKELELDLRHIDGVKNVHHLNVWQHTSNFNVMMVHLVIDLLSDSNTVLDEATKLALSSKYGIKHSTIQIERLAS